MRFNFSYLLWLLLSVFGALYVIEVVYGGLWAERLGDAFAMSVKAGFLGMPVWHLFQHEASHLYGALDYKGWDAVTTWCIMSYMWQSVTRSWCDGCTNIITANKHHFG